MKGSLGSPESTMKTWEPEIAVLMTGISRIYHRTASRAELSCSVSFSRSAEVAKLCGVSLRIVWPAFCDIFSHGTKNRTAHLGKSGSLTCAWERATTAEQKNSSKPTNCSNLPQKFQKAEALTLCRHFSRSRAETGRDGVRVVRRPWQIEPRSRG